MTNKDRLRVALIFIGVVAWAAFVFSSVYSLTAWIYKLIGVTLPPAVIQLINSMGGLLAMGLSITVASWLLRGRVHAGEMSVFGPIIEAMEKIAKGDFSVRVDPALDPQSPSQHWFGSLANSVNQMAVELDKMEIMRQEFISNVSHEIQSPLTSIQGFARALHNEHLDAEERQHYLSIIESETTRLSRLSDNLLKLASLEADQVKFEPRPYRLDKQVRSLILATEPQWMAKDLAMDVALDEVTITADEDLLSQVWLNLLHNSIKFTPEGGSVCVELHQQDGMIELMVKDTGIGISEDDQARIFERFYKADKSRTHRENAGSGLGLSIAQKIIEIHQGSLAVESQLGEGAAFTVVLPPT